MNRRKGFSLIELMVVIAIIAILAAIALPLYQTFSCRTKANEPVKQLADIKAALAAYVDDLNANATCCATIGELNTEFNFQIPNTGRWTMSSANVAQEMTITVTATTANQACVAGLTFTYYVDKTDGVRYQIVTTNNENLVNTTNLTGRI